MTSKSEAKKYFGRLISQGLQDAGLTQAMAAEKLGTSRRSVSNWAAGDAWPTAKVRAELEQILGWKAGALQEAFAASLGEHGVPLSTFTDAHMRGQGSSETWPQASTEALVSELLRRYQRQEDVITALNRELASVKLFSPPKAPDRS
ncbi:helix-turn-helix domain-containing protein [Arthrobacter sp. L77]|uniref:helix-turn-helix domain-containing protein n=1 Tax=Arthrobacter sp. L77 TaxID=1496689 RepID=UPI0018CD51B1|nr:helix-turn-helix transcriptional regulator [Arthrobacter sp. L77]